MLGCIPSKLTLLVSEKRLRLLFDLAERLDRDDEDVDDDDEDEDVEDEELFPDDSILIGL